ncbi:MAG: protein kinase [Myxococcales bacterium]
MNTAILDEDDDNPENLEESAGAGASGVHPVQRLKRGDPIGDKYIVQGSLGVGGFAVVYEAEHAALGRPVAIKVMHLEADTSPALVERFRQEARISAVVHHPNILDVYDTGTLEDGSPYLVMELITGETLYRRMARRGLTIPALVEVARQLLTALAVLGDRGIVHRDIKPENIMLSSPGRGLTMVKVLDFGISKNVEQPDLHLTISGSMIGTPHYMSPEQIRGENVDHRSDLYALGVVLYEAITGRVPFDAATLNALVLAALNEDLTPIHLLRPDCPSELERIVLKAMARDRRERYANAAEMLEDLEKLAAATRMPRGEAVWGNLIWSAPIPERERGEDTPERAKARHLESVREELVEFPVAVPVAPSQAPAPTVIVNKPRRLRLVALSAFLLLGAFEPKHAMPTAALASASAELQSAAALLGAGASATSSFVPRTVTPTITVEQLPVIQVTELGRRERTVTASTASAPRPQVKKLKRKVKKPELARGPIPKREVEDANLMKEAFSAYLRGDLEQAHGLYRRAVVELPTASEAWRGLGLVAARLGRYNEARRALSRYLALAPDALDAQAIAERKRALP